MNSTISVVVPAYNVDAYIGRCLESVLSQTFRDLDIIVVNDGSTDKTADIILKYSSDPRLRYVEQKNAGVSAARNKGIDAAKGSFIAFVDSDDYIEEDMYEKLHAALIQTHSDVAICDYSLVYGDHIDTKYSDIMDETVDIDAPDYFFKYCACPRPNNYIWTRLYIAGIIKKSRVSFENFRLGDDTLFNFKLLPYLSRAVYITGSHYNYLQRYNSNVYTVAGRGNLAKVYADTFQGLIDHYGINGFSDYLDAMPMHAYTRLRSVVFYSRLAKLGEDEIARNIEEGFKGRDIVNYLRDTSKVDRYVEINGLPSGTADDIKRIMLLAADHPKALAGVKFP